MLDRGVAKDRARPFSRKHRKYWLTVTGGMLLIGGINVGIGMCAYEKGPDTVERIIPVLPTSGVAELPVAVMRAFTAEHPQHAPLGGARIDATTYEVRYLDAGALQGARYHADGTKL